MNRSTRSIPATGERILLAVEDDASADLLGHRVQRRGLYSERVEHGGEVRQCLQSKPFDLVVIETRFPGLTGLELLRSLPSEEVVGTPYVVLLGRRANNEQIARAFEIGAAEYIQRPFAPDIALARIVRFLNLSEMVGTRPTSAVAGFPVGMFVLGADVLEVPLFPFRLMIGITAVLLLLAILLALIATGFHIYTKHRTRRHQVLASSWKPLFLNVLVGDTPPQVLIDEVDRNQEHAFLAFLAPYAATTMGRSKHVLNQLARPFLPHLEDDLRSRRAGHRARALQYFGLLGDDSCRDFLRQHLDDPSPLVRYTAFRWLARRSTTEDTVRLLKHLDRLSHVAVSQLSSALVRLGEAAAPDLRTYLYDDAQTDFVRIVCAETLRWMGNGEAAPIAAQLLAQEPAPELAAALLRLLRRVGRPKQAPLVRSYCTDEAPFVCIHAARALGQIGDPEDDRKLLRRLVTTTDSRWVALNAAKSLTELGQTTPLQHLSQSAHDRAPFAKNILNESQR